MSKGLDRGIKDIYLRDIYKQANHHDDSGGELVKLLVLIFPYIKEALLTFIRKGDLK
jgi:hypothetical protein